MNLKEETIDFFLVSEGKKIVKIKNEVIYALEEIEYGLGMAISDYLKRKYMCALEELKIVLNKNVLLQQLIKETKRKNQEEYDL